MAVTCYIGLGCNIGRRALQLQAAARYLSAHADIRLLGCSGLVETPAMLPPDAPEAWNIPFLNQVIAIETPLSPDALLDVLKACEATLGRQIRGVWGPREMDCDLLLYGEQCYQSSRLQVPHAGLLERDFVLVPLAQIAPNRVIPGTSQTVAQALSSLKRVDATPYAARPFVMGILNVTPDSFSDGGAGEACARLDAMVEAGADWLDIGAESTRPGAVAIGDAEEWSRLEAVLAYVRDRHAGRTWRLSVDTYHASTAKHALGMGANCINDVSGGSDPVLLRSVIDAGADYVAMHSLTVPVDPATHIPQESDIISYISDWADKTIERLTAMGLARSRLILDPGIGFGKTALHSLELLLRMDVLVNAFPDVRWLAGHSRKSFLHLLGNKPAAERDGLTFACSAALMGSGVDILRVHHVSLHRTLVDKWGLA